MMSDAELTAIYNEANGIPEGKRPCITTQRIFAAMRLVAAKERERYYKSVDGMVKDYNKLQLDYVDLYNENQKLKNAYQRGYDTCRKAYRE